MAWKLRLTTNFYTSIIPRGSCLEARSYQTVRSLDVLPGATGFSCSLVFQTSFWFSILPSVPIDTSVVVVPDPPPVERIPRPPSGVGRRSGGAPHRGGADGPSASGPDCTSTSPAAARPPPQALDPPFLGAEPPERVDAVRRYDVLLYPQYGDPVEVLQQSSPPSASSITARSDAESARSAAERGTARLRPDSGNSPPSSNAPAER